MNNIRTILCKKTGSESQLGFRKITKFNCKFCEFCKIAKGLWQ